MGACAGPVGQQGHGLTCSCAIHPSPTCLQVEEVLCLVCRRGDDPTTWRSLSFHLESVLGSHFTFRLGTPPWDWRPVASFLRGVLRLQLTISPRVLTGGLSLVLDVLSSSPFETSSQARASVAVNEDSLRQHVGELHARLASTPHQLMLGSEFCRGPICLRQHRCPYSTDCGLLGIVPSTFQCFYLLNDAVAPRSVKWGGSGHPGLTDL